MKLRSRNFEIPGMTTTTADTRFARDERVAVRALAVPDEERERYVMDLKRRVHEGTYHPTGMEIAEAILAERIAENTVL